MQNNNKLNNTYIVWCPLVNGNQGGYIKIYETEDLNLFAEKIIDGQPILYNINRHDFNKWKLNGPPKTEKVLS